MKIDVLVAISAIFAALAAYLLVIRSWHLRWGATHAEVEGAMPATKS